MVTQRRLTAFCIALLLSLCGLLIPSHTASAIDGCFTFKNSLPTFIPDDNDPLGGTWDCAGTAATDCQECIYIVPPDGGYEDCVLTVGGTDEWCRQSD
jgi:hypothetical protein